jgi:hypothetical protein
VKANGTVWQGQVYSANFSIPIMTLEGDEIDLGFRDFPGACRLHHQGTVAIQQRLDGLSGPV